MGQKRKGRLAPKSLEIADARSWKRHWSRPSAKSQQQAAPRRRKYHDRPATIDEQRTTARPTLQPPRSRRESAGREEQFDERLDCAPVDVVLEHGRSSTSCFLVEGVNQPTPEIAAERLCEAARRRRARPPQRSVDARALPTEQGAVPTQI